MGSWCCVYFHGAHVALGTPEMSTGALGLTVGLMDWGEGQARWGPGGHAGLGGTRDHPPHTLWCMEGWGGRGSGMVPAGLWAARDTEQGGLTITESFPLRQH